MQPFLAVATLVAALGVVAVNSETAYILAPVEPHHQQHHDYDHRVQRVLSGGWGWKPVRTISLQLPSISSGWGWKKPRNPITLGVYGGIRIGRPGWGQQHHGGGHGWGQQHHGWGHQQKQQHGWGWQPQKQHGWGWKPQKQHGWGWSGGDDDDSYEDDYRSTVPEIGYDDLEDDADSSEEVQDDESSSVESEEADYSAEDDVAGIDYRRAIAYNPAIY